MLGTEISCSIPVVSCIIERNVDGEKYILLQTRRKPNTPYHNSLEVPAGWIEKYENVFDAIKREVKEETTLDVLDIFPPQEIYIAGGDEDRAQSFQSFCCQQQLSGEHGLPRIGFCFVVQVTDGEALFQESETRNPFWVTIHDLQAMIADTPEKFFTLQLPFLLYYVKHHNTVTWAK